MNKPISASRVRDRALLSRPSAGEPNLQLGRRARRMPGMGFFRTIPSQYSQIGPPRRIGRDRRHRRSRSRRRCVFAIHQRPDLGFGRGLHRKNPRRIGIDDPHVWSPLALGSHEHARMGGILGIQVSHAHSPGSKRFLPRQRKKKILPDVGIYAENKIVYYRPNAG